MNWLAEAAALIICFTRRRKEKKETKSKQDVIEIMPNA
jgi:hypothetical protein